MCNALSRNIPATFKTIFCNCLSHGIRKFDDLKSFYPTPCLHIIKEIAKVYEHDEKTKALTHEERLRWHQQHSKPVMDELYQYIHHQLESRQVEPNDSLGKAIRYMLKHWHDLTQFLRVAGAPLDNNILERALKIPIRGRRTWLFYKTEYEAYIGGVITSVIYTCALVIFSVWAILFTGWRSINILTLAHNDEGIFPCRVRVLRQCSKCSLTSSRVTVVGLGSIICSLQKMEI